MLTTNTPTWCRTFGRRFWLCLVLTVPVLLISPTGSGHAFGPIGLWAFPGSQWLLLALGSVIYFYGGWPFLSGLAEELSASAQPGMMTLIALAISVAYLLLGRRGVRPRRRRVLLGARHADRHHAARPLDRDAVGDGRVRRAARRWSGLLPDDRAPHRGGRQRRRTSRLTELRPGDRVLVRPGEKVPADGVIVEGGDQPVDESMLTGESSPVREDDRRQRSSAARSTAKARSPSR